VQAQILAAAALVIDIAIPLLPVYGNGQTHFGLVVLPFPFWIGLANFLSVYAIAAVILVGLVSFAWRGSFAAARSSLLRSCEGYASSRPLSPLSALGVANDPDPRPAGAGELPPLPCGRQCAPHR
jgi:hypothetical protein